MKSHNRSHIKLIFLHSDAFRSDMQNSLDFYFYLDRWKSFVKNCIIYRKKLKNRTLSDRWRRNPWSDDVCLYFQIRFATFCIQLFTESFLYLNQHGNRHGNMTSISFLFFYLQIRQGKSCLNILERNIDKKTKFLFFSIFLNDGEITRFCR